MVLHVIHKKPIKLNCKINVRQFLCLNNQQWICFTVSSVTWYSRITIISGV